MEERIIMKTIKYAVKLASSYSDFIALKQIDDQKNNIMVLTISNGPHETELSTNIESIITAKKATRA